nr:putative ribonuclease H-like domain-containing protein [Tanacetum cinerariifolium]
ICLGVDLEPDEWINDSGCSKHMTGNRKLFSTYKAYNGGNIIYGGNLRGNIIGKGKQAHASHKAKNVVSTTRYLELLYMDIFGPSALRSYGGNHYTLVIVDDYSRNFMPPKPDLIRIDVDEYVVSESVTNVPDVATNKAMTSESKPKSVSEPLIKDWISDSKDENETKSKSKQRKPSFAKVEFVKPNEEVKSPIKSVKQEEHNRQAKHPRKISQSPRGDPKGGKITGKDKICTDTECVILSPDFKLLDESQVLLRVSKKNNMYSVDLKNDASLGGLTCLFAKATLDGYNLWHRRLGHINFKTMNKFVRVNHVRGKFDGKTDEGFFVGYSMNSKAFRVFNSRTRIVEETLHITFLENKPNVAESQPTWLFYIDTLTKSMNYKPVFTRNQSNGSACKARMETVLDKDYILLLLWTQDPLFFSSSKDSLGDGFKPSGEEEKKDAEDPKNEDNEVLSTEEPRVNQEKNDNVNSTNILNTVSLIVNAASKKVNIVGLSWVEAVQDELLQFKLQQVWTLVDLPYGNRAIGTKWIFRNKKDNRGIMIRNKARLMDVKSAFLYGKIEEDVYVCQPLGFEDPKFSDRVYKVEKALYGLHQASRAWYETLSTYLLDNRFQRGHIDKTLFIKKVKGDILLVQVYVDDIIFGSTRKEMCTEFEKMMHNKFQMSSMGELTFFLGLQVTQKDDGIFISQEKYMDEILKKFGFSTVKTASTPMETSKSLIKDDNAEDVDVHLYRSMIGSLMYLTSSRPDIMFVDAPFDLEAYTDSDYAGASFDRKSTTEGVMDPKSNAGLWIQFHEYQDAIDVSKNPMQHSRTKHIEIRHHFLRDNVQKGHISIEKVPSIDNIIDILTEPLKLQKAFDNTISWINSFVPMDKEVVEGSEKKAKSRGKEAVSKKRVRKGLDEESVKRQKL